MAEALNANHWRKRAKEARDIADKMSDPLARESMLRLAATYEKLAAQAEAVAKGETSGLNSN